MAFSFLFFYQRFPLQLYAALRTSCCLRACFKVHSIAPSIRVSLPYPDTVDFQPTGQTERRLRPDAGSVPQRSQYWHRTEHLIGPGGSETRPNLNRVGLG